MTTSSKALTGNPEYFENWSSAESGTPCSTVFQSKAKAGFRGTTLISAALIRTLCHSIGGKMSSGCEWARNSAKAEATRLAPAFAGRGLGGINPRPRGAPGLLPGQSLKHNLYTLFNPHKAKE